MRLQLLKWHIYFAGCNCKNECMIFAQASKINFHKNLYNDQQKCGTMLNRPCLENIEINLLCKAKHLLYIMKMSESTSKCDFERIVPVFVRESSRWNRPREELVFARNVP